MIAIADALKEREIADLDREVWPRVVVVIDTEVDLDPQDQKPNPSPDLDLGPDLIQKRIREDRFQSQNQETKIWLLRKMMRNRKP